MVGPVTGPQITIGEYLDALRRAMDAYEHRAPEEWDADDLRAIATVRYYISRPPGDPQP